jgi:hypothetical protein
MVASLWGSVGMGTEEDESSTGCIWVAGFHHVTTHSCLARILKLMNRLFLQFSELFSGHSKPQTTETADTGVRLYRDNHIPHHVNKALGNNFPVQAE